MIHLETRMEITRKLFKSESEANFLLLRLLLNKQTLAKSTPGLKGSTGRDPPYCGAGSQGGTHRSSLMVESGNCTARRTDNSRAIETLPGTLSAPDRIRFTVV